MDAASSDINQNSAVEATTAAAVAGCRLVPASIGKRSQKGTKRGLLGDTLAAGARHLNRECAPTIRKHSPRSSRRPLKLMGVGDQRPRWRTGNVKRHEVESHHLCVAPRHLKPNRAIGRDQRKREEQEKVLDEKQMVHWSLGKLARATVESKALGRPPLRRHPNNNGKQQDPMLDESGKRSIATCLKQNFYSKALSWQTSLVVEDEDDEDEDEEDEGKDGAKPTVGFRGSRQSEHLKTKVPYFDKIEKQAKELEGTNAFCQDYKSHLLACAAANLAAVAAASALPLEPKLNSTLALNSPNSSNNYQRAFFSYQASKDDGSKKDNRSDHSLHLRLDNIRYLMERNLIATLIGVYILVSMTVIILLVLPYLFTLPKSPPGSLELVVESSKSSAGNLQRVQQSIQTELMSAEPKPASRENVVQTQRLEPLVVAVNETAGSKVSDKSGPPYKHQEQPLVVIHSAPELKVPGVASEAATQLANQRAKYQAMWNKTHSQNCQPMQIPFCSRSLESLLQQSQQLGPNQQQQQLNLPENIQRGANLYDKTLLPNQFSHARQFQVQAILSRYESIVDIKCFALMPLFLCSIFAPKCVHVGDVNLTQTETLLKSELLPTSPKNQAGQAPQVKLVPPCRSLCKEAFRKCLFFFEVLSLKLFDPSDCELLPESSDPSVCLGQLENNWLKQVMTDKEVCTENEFRCSDAQCIPKRWRCDGFNDCKDKKDELNCSRCNVLTQFYCGQDKCIRKEQVCNGINDCSDGRDERQCLRLSPNAGVASNDESKNGQQKSGRFGRLEAWSAVEEDWVPVCGSLWSPMPMSHEACQALGYSRANETLILYSAAGVGRELTNRSLESAAQVAANQQASVGNVQQRMSSASGDSSGDLNVGWLNSWAAGAPEGQDSGEHMADIIEEAAENQAKLVRANKWADHLISYERLLSPDSSGQSAPISNHHQLQASGDKRLKSLVSMLYHGKETGCSGVAKDLTSTVHLRCQNFQCGRSITSYSTRVRQQLLIQRLKAKRLETQGQPTFRSALITTEEASNEDQYQPKVRQQMWVANDEEEEEKEIDDDEKEEEDYNFDLRNSTLPLDQLAIDVLGIEANQQQPFKPELASRLVVGGFESMPGEFPYLAALHGGPDEVFFCGGVLISINWLLTAAHCVGNRSRPDGWTVKVGVTRRIASQAFVKKLSVRKIIKHSQFNHTTFNNDIALILLEEKVEFNQYLRPICLPKANSKLLPENSKDCVVVGFGKSKFGQDSNYLHVAHFVNVPIVEHSTCSSWYEDHGVSLTQGMLCAGYAEGKRDACQGDSGSGLFCRYSNTNQFFVAGLVSFGIKCATPKLPGVYTSVPSYVDWIKSTTRQHGYMLD